MEQKKRARIEIQPRFKIQYPMKNRVDNKQEFPFINILNVTMSNSYERLLSLVLHRSISFCSWCKYV
jgi:hypothetical protein